jgi:transposase-like protein
VNQIVSHHGVGSFKLLACPRCGRQSVARMNTKSDRRDLDWFSCNGCRNIFTKARTNLYPRPT